MGKVTVGTTKGTRSVPHFCKTQGWENRGSPQGRKERKPQGCAESQREQKKGGGSRERYGLPPPQDCVSGDRQGERPPASPGIMRESAPGECGGATEGARGGPRP